MIHYQPCAISTSSKYRQRQLTCNCNDRCYLCMQCIKRMMFLHPSLAVLLGKAEPPCRWRALSTLAWRNGRLRSPSLSSWVRSPSSEPSTGASITYGRPTIKENSGRTWSTSTNNVSAWSWTYNLASALILFVVPSFLLPKNNNDTINESNDFIIQSFITWATGNDNLSLWVLSPKCFHTCVSRSRNHWKKLEK